MILGGCRVGQLLPQVVLGHFATGDAVQQGLRFRAFEDLRLADIVYGSWWEVLWLHLVQVQHFVEKFVLLLVVEHVDLGWVTLVVRGRLLGWHVWRRSLLLLLIFGDLRQQLFERFLLLIKVGGHWSISGTVAFRGRWGNQSWDWRIHRTIVAANAYGPSISVILATESSL